MSKKSKLRRAAKKAPDDTVYLTKTGIRVRVARSKQFPNHPSQRDWEKEMRAKANEMEGVFRVDNGHELWGVKREDLTPE